MSNEIIIVEDRKMPILAPGVQFLHPELQTSGPTRYRIPLDLDIWTHPNQRKKGEEVGYVIYKALKASNLLRDCASLQDGMEMQRRDTQYFFEQYEFPMWKSVAQHPDGLYVPIFYRRRGVALIKWVWLKEIFSLRRPALIFKPDLNLVVPHKPLGDSVELKNRTSWIVQ